jgi:hypothetical protein
VSWRHSHTWWTGRRGLTPWCECDSVHVQIKTDPCYSIHWDFASLIWNVVKGDMQIYIHKNDQVYIIFTASCFLYFLSYSMDVSYSFNSSVSMRKNAVCPLYTTVCNL